MRWGAWGAAVVALGLAGCSVLARNHACWPYLEERYGSGVPHDVVKQLAGERRSRKRVGTITAAIGYYWRPARPLSEEERKQGTLRASYRGWEIVPCPGQGKAEQIRILREGGALPSPAPAARPTGRPALPLDRRSRTVEE